MEQLEERKKQLAAEALPLRALAEGDVEWRRVECRGELRHKDAAFVRARCSHACVCERANAERASAVAGGSASAHRGGDGAQGIRAGAFGSVTSLCTALTSELRLSRWCLRTEARLCC